MSKSRALRSKIELDNEIDIFLRILVHGSKTDGKELSDGAIRVIWQGPRAFGAPNRLGLTIDIVEFPLSQSSIFLVEAGENLNSNPKKMLKSPPSK